MRLGFWGFEALEAVRLGFHIGVLPAHDAMFVGFPHLDRSREDDLRLLRLVFCSLRHQNKQLSS
jgi:hypothetical protein